MKKKILVVEDEADVRGLVSFHLQQAGFDVLESGDGEQALALLGRIPPDLIILDILLPGLSGWEVCQLVKRHRQTSDIPVLMLTARTEVEDRLRGFGVGAEDYLCKPFSVREVVLRVKALLKRVESRTRRSEVFFLDDGLVLDFREHRFSKHDQPLSLSPKEASILRYLVERRGEAVAKEALLQAVWGEDVFVELGNIEVHIRHLRQKIEPDPARPANLVTVRGVGYRFEM